jgi:thymidylate synthase (FAD)
MEVKLVAITKPTIEGVETAEDFIAYTARVSNPSNQHNLETAGKLVAYLMRNEHWSPFEMVHVVMEINTTRDIARQILRHRSFSYQEFSQRYADASQLGFEIREARLQDTKNRQNSIEVEEDFGLITWWEEEQERILEQIKRVYDTALKAGIAKEQARAILPEGITKSRLYMAGTFRSWYHYVMLRTAHGTQKEHMEVANAALEILKKEFPNIPFEA